jgi:succinoglycan biosynthesis transport protein ExoP
VSENRRSISVRDMIEMLFRRKGLLLTVMFVVLLATVAFTALTHRVFQSEMKFLVLNSRGNVVLTAEKAAGATTVADVTENQINSELEILNSRDVISPVADPAWDTYNTGQRTPEEVRLHERLVEDFQRRLAADPVRKSNVISVTLNASSAKEAHDELERLSTSYLAEHRRLQRPTGATGFFATQAEEARRAWDEAVQQMVAFQQKNKIVSIVDQQASLEKDIVAAQSDLRASQSSLSELDGRIKEDSARLTDMPHRQVTTRKTVPNQQAVEQLSTLLVELQNKRTALLTGYRQDDRLVKEVDEQIADTRAALTRSAATSSEELTSDVDPTYQLIRNGYTTDRIKQRAALEQRNALQGQLGALQRSLANVQALTNPFNQLQSKADDLKENYQLYVQKRDQATIEDAMDESKLLNVAVAERPTLSFTPVKPKPLTNFALGLVSAVFLGLCAVYLSEMSRNTFGNATELENLSRLPVLATLPCLSKADLASATAPRSVTLAQGYPGEEANSTGATTAEDFFLLACDGLVDRVFFQSSAATSVHRAAGGGIVIALTSPHTGTGVTSIAQALCNRLTNGNPDNVVCVDAYDLGASAASSPTAKTAMEDRFHRRVAAVAQLRAQYRFVIIDCPALTEPHHAIGLAPLVDGMLMVEEANRTAERQVFYSESILQQAKGNLLGHILNKRTYAIPIWLYRRLEAMGL